MAKKAKNKAGKKIHKIAFEQTLPQNILPVGERVEENKNIYISQAVYKEIHKFTKNKTTNESGGMLIGNVIEEFGKVNIVIHGFIEAKYCEATPTTLKFTHKTWDYVHSEIDKKYEKGQIVGWIHTHPDFGIFLSEYDTFIQENFFKEDHQIAYVVDPIQHIEGFYFWINEKIERCRGFYIFDKTGEKIEIEEEKTDIESEPEKEFGSGTKSYAFYGLAGALLLVILIFAIVCTNMLNRMKRLESQQEKLVNSMGQNISILQQHIGSLELEIQTLQAQMNQIKSDLGNNTQESTKADAGGNQMDNAKSATGSAVSEEEEGNTDGER